MYSYNLLSRIHTYFLHSYETNRLSTDEIAYIEQQLDYSEDNVMDEQINDKQMVLISKLLNNKKQKSSWIIELSNHSRYITTNYECVNYQEITGILNDYGIYIKQNQLEYVFDKHAYYKPQLLNDLCDAIGNKNDENVLLAQILINDLKYPTTKTRQKIYDLLLHEYIKKQELENDNFIKILIYTAHDLYPTINVQEIEQIARRKNVNINMFIKGKSECINAIKFGKMFKSLNDWDKKKWAKIYSAVMKWKPKKYQPAQVNKLQQKKDDAKYPEKDETKEETFQYIDEDNMIDEDILNLFCLITKAEQRNAAAFLAESNWDIDDAINKYYALSGNVKKLGTKYTSHSDQKNKEDAAIYNEGIKLWYWRPRNTNEEKCYVKSKYNTLKEEILASDQLITHQWDDLQKECQALLSIIRIKAITSNGKGEDVYGIGQGNLLTIQHLCAMKLYTDYTSLNRVFCATFRLKKLTNGIYERIQSLKSRNAKFAIWSRLLVECVQCYGSLLSTNKKYYRG
eukprot:365911_1